MELEKNGAGTGFDVIAHAHDADEARVHVGAKFTGHTITRCVELPETTKYFVVGEWDRETTPG